MTLQLSATSTVESPARVAPATPARTSPRRAVHAVPRHVWLLAIGVASIGVWLVVVGLVTLSRSHDLSGDLVLSQEHMIGPALLGLVSVVFLIERRWPAVPRSALSRAHVVDAGYLALYALIGPFVTLLNTGFAVEVGRHAHFLILQRLALLPQILVVILILVGIDAMNWAAHLANHRSAALWRFHALHHSQEDMSVFTTFRTHPLSHVSYLVAVLPALVLEANGTVPAAALIAYGCFVTLPHANLRWGFGPLGKIFVSPAFHRLHHAAAPVDGHMAANFGFVLVCWDRMAGTAVFPRAGRPVETGVGGRTVPIEQAVPRSKILPVVIAQLGQPFRVKAGLEGRP